MNSSQLNENEYNPYFKFYIEPLGEVNLIKVLTSSFDEFKATVKNLPEEKLLFKYDEEKWTIKELIQHLMDAERVLSYRALRFSRNDSTDLHGYNHDMYVINSKGNDREIKDLLKEFKSIRKATISLYKSFSNEMLTTSGSADKSQMSVRALGFIIAGHQMHHLKVIKELYL